MCWVVLKQSIVEKDINFVDGRRCGKILCWWRLVSFPQLKMSVVDRWTVSIDPLVLPASYMHESVGNGLVVKKRGS